MPSEGEKPMQRKVTDSLTTRHIEQSGERLLKTLTTAHIQQKLESVIPTQREGSSTDTRSDSRQGQRQQQGHSDKK